MTAVVKVGLSGSHDKYLFLFSFFPLKGLSKEPSKGSSVSRPRCPFSTPLPPDCPGCSGTSRQPLCGHLQTSRPGAARPWRQQGSTGTHDSGGPTPPGHMRLPPAETASLHLPMCTVACKASVYKSGSKKDRNPNNMRFTKAGRCLPFPFFPHKKAVRRNVVISLTLKPHRPSSCPAVIFIYHPCDFGQVT